MAEKHGRKGVREVGPGSAAPAATAAAVAAVARIVHAVVCEETGSPLAPPQPSASLVLDAHREDGRCVGGLLLEPDEEQARVSWWAVERPERGTGLGRQLLKKAEEWCEAKGISRLTVRAVVSVPSAARLLWTCGFRVSSLDATEVGGRSLEVLWFEKNLPRAASRKEC